MQSLVDESQSSDPLHPSIAGRYFYSPYGEAHVESAPELLRAHIDGDVTSANGAPQSIADPRVAAPGALLLDWSAALDATTLATGVALETQVGGTWTALTGAEVAIALDASATKLTILPTHGWAASTSYRLRLMPSLHDTLGRALAANETLELRTAAAPATGAMPALPFDRKTARSYESWQAANDTLGNRFPGGQNHLFQGAWTDPVTGLAYHRARWYEPRTAHWLSEDPAGTVDSVNLQAFVGWGPQGGRDPLGLVDVTTTREVPAVPCPTGFWAGKSYPEPCPDYLPAATISMEETYILPGGIALEDRAKLVQTGMSDADVSVRLALLHPGEQPPSETALAVARGAELARPVVEKTWAATELFVASLGMPLLDAEVPILDLAIKPRAVVPVPQASDLTAQITYYHRTKPGKVTELGDLRSQMQGQIDAMNKIIEREGMEGLKDRIMRFRSDPSIEQAGRAHVRSLPPAGCTACGDPLAWLHGPDMAAGGGATDIVGLGLLRNNSILGGQANRIADEILAMSAQVTRIEGRLVIKAAPAKASAP